MVQAAVPAAVVTGNAVRSSKTASWVSTGEEGIVSRKLQDLLTLSHLFGDKPYHIQLNKDKETFQWLENDYKIARQ